MPNSLDEWFVQLGLGVFLGPMPLSDMQQLAASGALLESDQVRQSGADEWLAARDVPGLFGPTPDEWIALPEESSLPLLEVAANGSTPSAIDGETSSEVSQIEGITPAASDDEGFTLAPAARAVPRQPVPARPLDSPNTKPELPKVKPAPLPIALARPSMREIPPAPKPVTHDFEYEFPKAHPGEAVTAAMPKLGAMLVGRSATADDEPLKPIGTEPLAPESVAAERRAPEAASTAPPARLGSRPVPFASPRSRRANRVPPSWLRPLLIGIATIAIVTLVWGFWPSKEPNIYAQYRQIYDELQRYRTGTGDAGQWPAFVEQARETTAATIPWLESTTRPGDRDKDLLLYVGRDLQASLELEPDAKFRHQQRLDGFMSQLRESFGDH